MIFDDIVKANISWLGRVAFRFYSNKFDAEDLAQDTLCRIYYYRDKYDISRDFKPWAITIMTNIYKNRKIHNGRVVFVGLETIDDMVSSIRADNMIIYNSTLDAIYDASLRYVGVECVILYADGYSYNEIADIVGIKPGTVKSRILSGRRVIKQVLGECCI